MILRNGGTLLITNAHGDDDTVNDPNIITLAGEHLGNEWTMEVVINDPPHCHLCEKKIGVEVEQDAWKLHSASPVCVECVATYRQDLA